MSNLVSQAEFARMSNRSAVYINKLKFQGRLVMEGTKVNVEASRKLIEDTADPGRADVVERSALNRNAAKISPVERDDGYDDGDVAASFQKARALREHYNAQMAKLDYEKASATLVEADEVKLFAADFAATVRGALETLPDRISSDLAALTDSDEVRALLIESFEQLLLDLSLKISKGVK